MIELNLIPDVKLQFVHAQRSRRRVITTVTLGGIVAIGLVVLFAIYVYAVQPVRGLVLNANIDKASKQLSSVKGLNNYLTIQQQLKELPGLHESKPVYSRIISYLTTLNPGAPNNIHITQLSIDSATDANTIVIEAYAPTYTAATVFQSTLESAQFSYSKDGEVQPSEGLFTKVELTNTALGQDSSGNKVVAFTVTLTANDNVFDYGSTNAGVTVPNKDATNSAQAAPEVFADSAGSQ